MKKLVNWAGAAFFCLEPEPTLNWSQPESALGPRTSGAKAGAAQKSGDSASATLITASNLFLVSILEWKKQSLSLMPIFVCAWIWFVFRLRIRNLFRPLNTIRPLCTGIWCGHYASLPDNCCLLQGDRHQQNSREQYEEDDEHHGHGGHGPGVQCATQ